MRPSEGMLSVPLLRAGHGTIREEEDLLAVEAPLEMALAFGHTADPSPFAITMRTPGDDAELVAGFLYGEGILQHTEQLWDLREEAADDGHRITAVLDPVVEVAPDRLRRRVLTTSSCGVCGKASLEALRMAPCPALPAEGPVLPASVIHGLPAQARQSQSLFACTGGMHAAALFDSAGRLVAVREDVGRHNAVDKLVGWAFLTGRLPLREEILLVSGRASYELVQKALRAGIPVMAAVGAPSSLAVRVARAFGLTLLGFVRDDRFNVYSAPWRLAEARSVSLTPPRLPLEATAPASVVNRQGA